MQQETLSLQDRSDVQDVPVETAAAGGQFKPQLRFEMRQWWTCMDPAHKHVQQGAAARCIKKALGRGHSNVRWTAEMLKDLARRRLAGETCAALGIEFGVSRNRISQLMKRVQGRRAAQ